MLGAEPYCALEGRLVLQRAEESDARRPHSLLAVRAARPPGDGEWQAVLQGSSAEQDISLGRLPRTPPPPPPPPPHTNQTRARRAFCHCVPSPSCFAHGRRRQRAAGRAGTAKGQVAREKATSPFAGKHATHRNNRLAIGQRKANIIKLCDI
jgi:hypothetical protein